MEIHESIVATRSNKTETREHELRVRRTFVHTYRSTFY